MKKEVIIVPKDKCPLDILAELGEQTKSAWIFLHRNAVKKLISIADDHSTSVHSGVEKFFWNATDDFPETTVEIELHPDMVWLEVYRINADDIVFTMPADDPDEVIFMKIEE